MASKLKNLRLDRIDLVDKGASQDKHGEGAHVVLFKRADVSKADHCDAHKAFDAECPDCVKMRDGVAADEATAMKAVDATAIEAVKILIENVVKVGRKISATRLGRLKAAQDALAAVLAEAEDNNDEEEGDVMKIDVSKLAPEVQAHIAEIEKAATTAQDMLAKRVADLEAEVKKLAPGPTQDELMKNVPDAIRKQMDEQAKEIKDTKEKLAKSEDERLAKQYEGEVQDSFTSLALDPAKDGPVLKAIDQKLTKEEAARVREILTSTNALLEKSDLFVEKGAGGDGGSGTGTAFEQIQKLAQAKVDKKECATLAQGIDAVAKEHPELYEQHQEEQNG